MYIEVGIHFVYIQSNFWAVKNRKYTYSIHCMYNSKKYIWIYTYTMVFASVIHPIQNVEWLIAIQNAFSFES